MKDTVAARAIDSPGTDGNVTPAHVTNKKSQLNKVKKRKSLFCAVISQDSRNTACSNVA